VGAELAYRDGGEGDGSVEEDQSGNGDGELVESSDHGVGGGGSNTDTPGGGVRDEDGGETGEQDSEHNGVTLVSGEVALHVGGRPVLEEEGEDNDHGNGEKVVVEHGVKVLEVGQLDTLAHTENVGSGGQAVHKHPDVSSVESRESGSGLAGAVSVGSNGGVNVGPGGNNGRENHQSEGEQGHVGDGSTEPEDLSVGDKDDGQVLEDGVDGNGEVLNRLGTGVDHGNEEERDGEPLASLLHLEVTEVNHSHELSGLDSDNTNDVLHDCQLMPGVAANALSLTWNAKSKKLRLKSAPKMYLFVKVIKILATQ
jgi:hypothetical protein